ncbi:hypothetical protein BP6252_00073 [Coleophoma cylindrospora]|uniref:Rhodopsin domain-containing protein n=1 Tax=Coleophoma cylindrospora TaxID=1849047 RepID=A0A3D8SPD9_9HELO|nr:hypothetical protein BP6252_00073 [Coleophoma cylindrospora]
MDVIRTLIVESAIFYAIGISLAILRLCAQGRRYGIGGLKIEDKLMVVASLFYTLLVVFNIFCNVEFDTGLDTASGIGDLATENPRAYIAGSKYVLISEQGMINTLYTLKICMLGLYHRLTTGQREQLAVKIVGGYCILGWIANQIAFFTLTCQPFAGNWAIPPPNDQCVDWHHYSTVQGICNISSDLAILAFPIPLFWRPGFAIKQRIYLCCVFSLGIFVILCATINKLNIDNTSWPLWNLREASCALYVSNIPVLASLTKKFVAKNLSRLSTTRTNTKNQSTNPDTVTAPVFPPATSQPREKQFDKVYDPVVQDWREISVTEDEVV